MLTWVGIPWEEWSRVFPDLGGAQAPVGTDGLVSGFLTCFSSKALTTKKILP